MVEPTPTTVTELDQAIIDAGRELVRARVADVPDPERIAAAREALIVARGRRWPDAG